MRIDWKAGWRLWPGDFANPPQYTTQPSLSPRFVRFCGDAERGWLEEVPMAEMTELDAIKVLVADKQIALEELASKNAQLIAILRAVKSGDVTLDRLSVDEQGTVNVVAKVVEEASQVADAAEGNK